MVNLSSAGAFSEKVLLMIMPVGLYFGVLWSHANKTKGSPMIRMPAENLVVEVSVLFTDFIAARYVSWFSCNLLFYL